MNERAGASALAVLRLDNGGEEQTISRGAAKGGATARLEAMRSKLIAYFHDRAPHGEAEDFAQETIARLCGSTRFASAASDAYIFTIAKNLLRDRIRRTATRHRHGQSSREDFQAALFGTVDELNAERVMLGREAIARVVKSLDSMSERTRQIFLLYRLEGWTQRQIANHFNISTSAVEKHVARAVVQLAKTVKAKR
ncbi:RNA polymerase sigma factor [Novosphingobium sp. PP1Y]|uniref:RNA polymerase sigma factor n=1 Tax=Novosphingobium sp. PP1Y TaxID=702113 RepID=UPI0002EE78CD|nr:sigma-70 family RNA polymerase sigma factor [Novosphingobium sp. PP1Y]